jgi:mono/diheme cytochrome c family protein
MRQAPTGALFGHNISAVTAPFARALTMALFCLTVTSAQNEDKISPADAKKLKSSVAYSKKSIADGRTLFARQCTSCHGPDGKAQVDVVADATDLTSPKLWKSGTSEGEIFRSIRDGAGETMPPFKSQLSTTEMWNLVNFIRSLWPESMRPPLQEKDGNGK